MNKAIPWNVNGVGFDAREAAREAARRQGKSLGEWLHGVIADHAAGIGVAEADMAQPQKIDAVTAKLERLSARSTEHDRHVGSGRPSGRDDLSTRAGRAEAGRRPDAIDDDQDEDELGPRLRRRHRNRAAVDSADVLLEHAIDAMDRRALRVERRTDKALQSVAEMLRRNESHRERERDSVSVLARQLSDIETRLSDRLAQVDDNPVKSALARLEARLDTIGRRSAAEALARQQSARRPVDATSTKAEPQRPESLHRLEEKLNSILDAVHARSPKPASEASPIAVAASQAPGGRGRLSNAIADITKRQDMLDDGAPAISLREAILRRGGAPFRRPEARYIENPAAPAAVLEVHEEISVLASKIEDLRRDIVADRTKRQPLVDLGGMREEIAGPGVDICVQDQMREIRDLIAANATQPFAVERIETRIADLSDRIDRRSRFGGARDLDIVADDSHAHSAHSTGAQDLAKIERKLEDLAAKIDQAVNQGSRGVAAHDRQPPQTAVELEALVRDLGRKMEAVQAPGAGHDAFDALQAQIAALAAQFERSDEGFAKLGSLERSMRDLFVHLEETRASVETSAQRAAREVLRIAVEEGRAHTQKGTATSLATMQALQEEADARTNATLSAVHETLEKVVDRLSTMESDLADVRSHPVAAAAQRGAPASSKPSSPKPSSPRSGSSPRDISLGAADSFDDPMLGHRPGVATKTGAGRPISIDLDDDQRRAGFIAAARRAAKAAQTDASVADLRRPPAATGTDSAVRASLIAQSRDYVARHKRPVLLSIAALFVIVGTMALVQRIGLGGDEGQTAGATLPAPIARVADAATNPAAMPRPADAELTPSALPRGAPALATPIPGSDPIQTGSIPSLPAFAQSVAAPQPRLPVLPAALTKMAKAGDGAAEYVLGTQYAEGRLVPRDFKEAARWYQKAAEQGVAPAQYRLASLYEKGLGVMQDKAKAKSLYVRAAEAGNPRAMHNLAVMLADGDGHPDYDGAATWFRKAAQYGVHDSQYNLAILLARGLGTQQSFVQSYQWFAIAATQNDVDAAKKRDEVATRLNANDLAVAKALAAAYRPRTPDVAATEVQPPPGGWDGAAAPSSLNSPRPKISML